MLMVSVDAVGEAHGRQRGNALRPFSVEQNY